MQQISRNIIFQLSLSYNYFVYRLLMKQLAFQLGRQQVFLDVDGVDVEDQDDLVEIMANAHLNANFLSLAREVQCTVT